MTLVAVAALAVAAVCVLSCSTVIARQARQHARERMLLVNQIMHLSGRPWQAPPAAQREVEIDEVDRATLPFLPDQLPS